MNTTTLPRGSVSHCALTALALTALAAAGATSAQAQTGLTNRSQITGGSQITFGSVPDYRTGSTVPSGATLFAQDGTPAVVTGDGPFYGATDKIDFHSSFSPGDKLLYNGGSGPITFTFNTGLSAIGTQFSANSSYAGTPFPFTAEIQTFGKNGNPLAAFTEVGSATDTEDNSAIFLGVQDATADIYSATFSLTDIPDSGTGLIINQVSIKGAPPVPEASTTVSFGLLLALGGVIVAAKCKTQRA